MALLSKTALSAPFLHCLMRKVGLCEHEDVEWWPPEVGEKEMLLHFVKKLNKTVLLKNKKTK
jgi:hypothetical protein